MRIQKHEIIHQEYEKRDVNVNRCKSCLRKVHEIKGKQHTRKSGGRHFSCQLSGKEIDHGNHGNAKERAGDAPAEGIHAEQQHAEGDQKLAERWMRVFVSGQPVKKFIGGARVIDLVEIAAVHERGLDGGGALLVGERHHRAAGRGACGRYRGG